MPKFKCLTTEEFIKKAKDKHKNKYEYTNTVYKNSISPVMIKCLTCNADILIKPNYHLTNKNGGCLTCYNNFKKLKYSHNLSIFIDKGNITHDCMYEYPLDNEYINSKSIMKIICHTHGEFTQEANSHIMGSGCPKCKASKGEIKIRKWLDDNGYSYKEQKRFTDCRHKLPLPFDFYLPTYNTCIEFDGEHHFKPYSFTNNRDDDYKYKNFLNILLRDKIKNDYCLNKNITLIRIPYTKLSAIDSILCRYF